MHQFCEAKYVMSPYIAEFWNTVSNLPFFIIPGVLSLYRGWNVLDLRMKVAWCTYFTTGMGSFMFHASMRFKWEMLDELPMLVLMFVGIMSKDDTHWITSGKWKTLIHIVAICLCGGGLYLYLVGGMYFAFIHTFTLLIVIDALLSFICSGRPDKNGSWAARRLWYAYVASISVARIFWELEVAFCPAGSGGHLQIFHVFWHILSGLACYLAMLSAVQMRYSALGVGKAVDAPGEQWTLVGLICPGSATPKDKPTSGAKKSDSLKDDIAKGAATTSATDTSKKPQAGNARKRASTPEASKVSGGNHN